MESTGLFFVRSGIQSIFRFLGIALCLAMVAQPFGSDRVRALSDRVLAPCCWREAVSVHQSPAAEDIRQRIANEVDSGGSDEAIVKSLIGDYGKRILREPEGPQRQWLYWIPVVLVSCGAILVTLFVRRSVTAPSATSTVTGTLPEIDLPEED
ncbi:MAG: cytochrome c-type biogenesis protein CcmH [Bryobacteraceae bacterium]|nr:cytochrome c-type biogenesis protein CcmH [Bryobacteraceae bacterium]